jgi:hypothetical protein
VSASTGGWLVTRVETAMPWFGRADDGIAALRKRLSRKLPPPPSGPASPGLAK